MTTSVSTAGSACDSTALLDTDLATPGPVSALCRVAWVYSVQGSSGCVLCMVAVGVLCTGCRVAWVCSVQGSSGCVLCMVAVGVLCTGCRVAWVCFVQGSMGVLCAG